MKNNKFAKSAIILLAMVLVCVGSVAGTLAYLTSTSLLVTNTFTVGDVKITLDEAPVDVYGNEITNKPRVQENTYKLIPGHKYTKDPTVHVTLGSEKCWLFVKVTNGIEAIEAANNTIAAQMEANGWIALDGQDGIYYHAAVDASSKAQDVKVFGEFTLKTDALVDNYKTAQITIKALAVQEDGFATAAEAYAAAPNNWAA